MKQDTNAQALLAAIVAVTLHAGCGPRTLLAPPTNTSLKALDAHDDPRQASAYAFEVTSSGEAIWQMPVWTPAGRHGVTPSLGFSYRSRAPAGLMGRGFDVTGLSAISRCWKTLATDGRLEAGSTLGVPNAYCLDGQRLVQRGTNSAELQPEFDPSVLVRVNGPFTDPSSFDVFHANGQIWRYGAREACPFPTIGSQSHVKAKPLVVSAPVDSNGLFTSDDFTETFSSSERTIAWNVDRVEDHWGNFYDVNYLRLNATPSSVEVFPGTIVWTGFDTVSAGTLTDACSTSPSRAPSRKIEFKYLMNSAGHFTPRLDPGSYYRAGIEVRQSVLLHMIEVSGPDAITSKPSPGRGSRRFRSYQLFYKPVPPGMRVLDRIDRLEECVYNSPLGAVCLEPISFAWTADNPVAPQFRDGNLSARTAADPSLGLDFPFDSAGGVDEFTANLLDSTVADFDGDGRDDYLYRTFSKIQSSGNVDVPPTAVGQWFLRRGSANGLGPREAVTGLPTTAGAGGLPNARGQMGLIGGLAGDFRYSPRPIDIDQDGRAELLMYSEDAVTRPGSDTTTDTAAYNLFSLAAHPCASGSACFIALNNTGESETFRGYAGFFSRRSFPVEIGDFDGDGKPDLLRDNSSCDPTTFCFFPPPPVAQAVIGMGFRQGQTLGAADFGPASKLTGGTFRELDGRYVVDVDGNGQPEVLTKTYDNVPTEDLWPYASNQFPVALSVLSLSGTVATNLPTQLTARPLMSSQMMSRLRGACDDGGSGDFTRLFLDVNGDGLDDAIAFPDIGTDVCNVDTNATFLSLNAGGFFRAAQQLPFHAIGSRPSLNADEFPPPLAQPRGYDNGARVLDVDGDGRVDIAYFGDSGVFWLRSTGVGFQQYQLTLSNGQLVPGTATVFRRPDHPYVGFGPRLARFGDFDGDGFTDIVALREQASVSGSQHRSFLDVNLGVPSRPDAISAVSGGQLRPKISIDYEFGTAAQPGNVYQRSHSCGGWPQHCLKKLGWAVKSYGIEAGTLNSKQLINVYNFHYDTARTDVSGRGFLGVTERVRKLLAVSDPPWSTSPPSELETETTSYSLSPIERVCRTDVICAYPGTNAPSSRVVATPIDSTKYRLNASLALLRHMRRGVVLEGPTG